jgi:predicted nucleic acid-binding protein
MYLVDTNVISEARKGKKANPGVQKFFRTVEAENLYLSVQTIGEIRRGLENIRHRGDLPQAKKLEKWLDLIVTNYDDRMLSFDVRDRLCFALASFSAQTDDPLAIAICD